MLGVIIEYFVHPTNKVYHLLTPQPRSFLRELPTLGVLWFNALHQTVSFKQRTNKMVVCRGIEPLLPEWKSSVLTDRRTDR